MDQKCDKCGQSVEGLVKVLNLKTHITITNTGVLLVFYEKGLNDFSKRKSK